MQEIVAFPTHLIRSSTSSHMLTRGHNVAIFRMCPDSFPGSQHLALGKTNSIYPRLTNFEEKGYNILSVFFAANTSNPRIWGFIKGIRPEEYSCLSVYVNSTLRYITRPEIIAVAKLHVWSGGFNNILWCTTSGIPHTVPCHISPIGVTRMKERGYICPVADL